MTEWRKEEERGREEEGVDEDKGKLRMYQRRSGRKVIVAEVKMMVVTMTKSWNG